MNLDLRFHVYARFTLLICFNACPIVLAVQSEALKQLHAPGLAAGIPATPYTCSDADNAVLVLSDSDLEMVKYERTNAGRPYKKITECKPQKSEFVKKPQG